MEAKEFRKGNYVQDVVSGEWMIIDEIGENIGAVIINRDKYPLPDGWQMGPIPLTPEILEKAGFINDDGEFTNPSHRNFDLMFFQSENKLWCAYNFGDVKAGQPFDVSHAGCVALPICEPFKYVHQLQNLYFALTGEELKIEL